MANMYDIVIIGGGPGGYSAALYAARAGREHWHFVRCCVVPGESIAADCRALGSRR